MNVGIHPPHWHAGEKIPEFISSQLKTVYQLRADGDEKELLENMFPYITATGKRSVYFYGDLARTVMLNLINS